MSELENAVPNTPYLCLKSGGKVNYFELTSGSNALVGSGSHCKIQLEGEDIRSLHCILAMDDNGQLEVRDWNTGSTFFNGQAISDPTIMNEGDCLRIGAYEINAVLGKGSGKQSIGSLRNQASNETVVCDEQFPDFWTRTAESSGEDAAVEPEEESLIGEEPNLDDDAPNLEDDANVEELNAVDADEVHRLRMEVEQLRSELAEKNSKSEQNSDLLSREQTTLMVTKLGELLTELKRSEVRSREMEELLRVADKAASDEQEERRHIEKWVLSLEKRVDQREQETKIEVQRLSRLLQQARDTQLKSNECLKSVIENRISSGEPVPMELANEMKRQIESLLSQLNTAHVESKELRQQLEQRSAETATARVSANKLAEMQLEYSRQRAAVSRERAELQRLKADMGMRSSGPDQSPSGAQIPAMQAHLNELQYKEQQENAHECENSCGGLTNRITNLLQRESE